jgi:hypothetical protein
VLVLLLRGIYDVCLEMASDGMMYTYHVSRLIQAFKQN